MASSIAFDIFARDRASATFERLGKNVEKSESRFAKFGKTALVVGAVVGAALVKFGAESVKAFEDAAKSQRVLEDAYARFPKIADVTIEAFRKQADAIQNKTGFDNDQIAATDGMLASYGLFGSQIQQLTPLIVDYAAKTGKSLPDATRVAGKALLGQGRALKDIGIAFKDTKTPMGNFNELMTGLRQQVGGFADKEGKTATGRAEILKKKFEDFQEAVGQKLVPALEKLTTAGIAAIDWMNKNKTVVTILAGVIGGALVVAIGAATVAWVAFNLAFIATPVGALITGMILVGIGLVILYKKFQIARDIINGAWSAISLWIKVNVAIIKGLFTGITTALRKLAVAFLTILLKPILLVFGAILSGAAIAFGWVPGIGGKLRKARDAFNTFKDEVNAIIDKIAGKKTFVLDASVSQATKNAFALYLNTPSSRVFTTYFQTVKLPGGRQAGFASGGRPPVNEASIVGERGPELFVPDTAGTIIPNNRLKGGGSNLTAGAIANAVAAALSGARFEFDGDGLARLVTARQNGQALKGPRR